MKTVVLTILLVSNLLAITAKEYAPMINAVTNMNTAFNKAKVEKKRMILLMVIKDGCHWCEKMIEKTMQDKTVKASLSDTVIVITDFGSDLANTFKAEETPSLYFIDVKTKKTVYEQVGYEKPGSFLITVNSALDNIN